MIIDAHQHFWDPARGDYGWLTAECGPLYRRFLPDDLAPLLADHGVGGTLLVQAAPTEAETDYLLSLFEATPWILGVVGWADLDHPDVPRRPGLVGLRPMLQDLPDRDWILAPSRQPALAAMAQAGLVFDALIRPAHLPMIAKLTARHPDLSIVVDHGAKPAAGLPPDPAWADGMRRLAAHPAVACKISGLLTEAGPDAEDAAIFSHLDLLAEIFGSNRLIFGSDWPVLTATASYGRWFGLVLEWLSRRDSGEAAAILGGNARRIYLDRGHP